MNMMIRQVSEFSVADLNKAYGHILLNSLDEEIHFLLSTKYILLLVTQE